MTIKNKINLTIVLSFVLIVLFFLIVTQPTFKEIKNNSQTLISEKEKLLSLEDKTNNLENQKAIYETMKLNLGEIDDLLLNSDLPVEFFSFLEETADNSQIKIKISPIPGGKTDKDIWPSLSFQVNLAGSFTNFLKFLEKIENAPYLISIQNLNINSSKEKGDTQSTLSFKVYTR